MKDFPERSHFIRFRHRFSGVLVENHVCAFPINGDLQVFKVRLVFPNFFGNIFHGENEILFGYTHCTTGSYMLVAGTQNPFGPFITRSAPPYIVYIFGNRDIHGACTLAASAHGADPDPGAALNFFIHSKQKHS